MGHFWIPHLITLKGCELCCCWLKPSARESCDFQFYLRTLLRTLALSSEELLHRARGGARKFIWIWPGAGGGVQGVLRITCSQGYILVKDYCSSLRTGVMIIVLFYVREDTRIFGFITSLPETHLTKEPAYPKHRASCYHLSFPGRSTEY